MAVLVTQIAAAGATLSWTFAEWFLRGKPSVLGAISGAIAGLVAITPATGFVLHGPALAIGLVAGTVCFWTATTMKRALGATTIVWTRLACTASAASSARRLPAGTAVGGMQLLAVQAVAVLATIAWCAFASWVLLKITDAAVGLRVTTEPEREGLNIVLYGEQVF